MTSAVPGVTVPRRVYFDAPAPDALLDLASTYGLRRILLVHDGASRFAAEGLASALASEGIQVEALHLRAPCRAAGASPESVEAIASSARDWGPDALVAVGEPCTICASKLALARLHRPTLDLSRVTLHTELGIEGSRPLLVAVPVGGSRGREADMVAALDYGDRIEVVANRELVPFAAVIDPALSAPAPRRDAAVDVYLDAITHAFESLVSRTTTPVGVSLAESAIRMLAGLAPRIASEPPASWWRDYILATGLSSAASAFGVISLTCAAAMALQEAFGTPHGRTAAVILRHTLRLYEEGSAEARGRLERLVAALERVDGHPSLGSAGGHLDRILDLLGAPKTLRDLGVPQGEFERLLPKIASRVESMPIAYMAPVRPSRRLVAELLERAYSQ